MLEGDGLAEKWAAAHGQDHNLNLNFLWPNNKGLSRAGSMPKNPHHHQRSNSMLGASFDDCDDEHSLDSFAMELSGPR